MTVVGVLFGLAFVIPFLFTNWPNPPGDDWLWYRNGFDRIAEGAPLYEPSWLSGPYDYLAPANVYQWNQAPWMLPLVVPFALLPEPLDHWAWLAAMSVAMLAAVLIAVPYRFRGVALVVWGPTMMAIAWANVECVVVLGIALWIVGNRRSATWLEAIGIVLASVKVLPAVPLVLLCVKRRRWRSIALAATIWALLLLPAVALRGPRVIPDFVTAASNIEVVPTIHNLSPALWLHVPLIAVRILASLAIVASMALRPTWLALAVAELLVVALPTNPYVDWLVPAALALLSRPASTSPMRGNGGPIMEYSADASP